jgi:hypothetical protein
MANPSLWSHEKFAGFMKTSPRRAFEFRLETLGDAIPEEYLTQEEKDGKNIESTVTIPSDETPNETLVESDKVEVEYTRDELKAKLDEKQIKYFKGADSQKLADLCIENNLL